jgi:hypothetical protein
MTAPMAAATTAAWQFFMSTSHDHCSEKGATVSKGAPPIIPSIPTFMRSTWGSRARSSTRVLTRSGRAASPGGTRFVRPARWRWAVGPGGGDRRCSHDRNDRVIGDNEKERAGPGVNVQRSD